MKNFQKLDLGWFGLTLAVGKFCSDKGLSTDNFSTFRRYTYPWEVKRISQKSPRSRGKIEIVLWMKSRAHGVLINEKNRNYKSLKGHSQRTSQRDVIFLMNR